MLLVGLPVAAMSLAVTADAAPAPPSLVAPKQEMPAFRYASSALESSTSPTRFVRRILGYRGRGALREIARLRGDGFREGVEEFFSGLRGEAISIAYVLGSHRAARRLLAAEGAEDISEAGTGVTRFPVPSIPGAIGYEGLEAGGGYANVLFVTGRCYLVVGNAIHILLGAEQPTITPIAGAVYLHRRLAHLCA